MRWLNDRMGDMFDDVGMGERVNEVDVLLMEMVGRNEDLEGLVEVKRGEGWLS